MQRTARILWRLLILAWLAGCSPESSLPQARVVLPVDPGLPRYQQAAMIPVPGGLVNAADLNLLIRRVDLSIDTRLGTRELGAVFNSATGAWLWSFEMHYDGELFVDATGARYATGALAAGQLIPGSSWLKLDATRIRSVGGLVHEFDSDGRLAAVHWASDPHPRLEYLAEPVAGARRTTEIRQCRAPGLCAGVFSLSYNAKGRLVAIEDRAGRRAEFGYDGAGQLVVARDALDVARGWPGFRYEYQPFGRLVALVSSEGERVEFETGSTNGRTYEVRLMGAEPAVHRFSLDKTPRNAPLVAPAHWRRHVDPLGHATLYYFDSYKRLRIVRLPTGEEIHRGWSGYEVSKLRLPGGATTTWQHVDPDEVLRRDPSGNLVRIDFRIQGGENRADPQQRPIDRVEDDLGLVEQRHYEDGRLIWIENGAGERTRFAYDAENLIASATGPDGIALGFADYGEHGHAESLSFAGEVESRVFDAVGNLLRRSGLERHDLRPGGEIARAFDEDRNPSRIELADAPASGPTSLGVIQLEYRSDGRPTRISRPHGGDHEFVYDEQGRLIERRERVDGSWQPTRYEADALGRPTAVELPNGMRREVEYDASGRVQAVRALRNGTLESAAALGWADDRLHSIADAQQAGVELYGYDAAGRLASIDFPAGERLETQHDARGRRVAETYRLAGGSVLRTLGFAYDAADRRVSLSEDGTPLVEHVYADARLSEVQTGNGLRRLHAYDPASGRLTATTTLHPVQGVIETTVVELEPVLAPGSVQQLASTTLGGALAGTSSEQYALDPAGEELPAAGKRVLEWSDGVESFAYAYDALGNLTQSGADDRLHRYNAEHNRLLRIEDAASGAPLIEYAYDAAGYVEQRDGVALAWTAHGCIAAVGEDVFEWDALGRLRRRVLSGDERRFRFGGRVETDAAGTPLRLDLDEVVLHLESGERRYRHRDFRGNVKLVSDDAGELVAHYHYEPYGIHALVGADEGAASFAGGLAVGKLVLLGPRLHDPAAGRFLAPDPVFQPVSQLGYAQGNPVWWWDPGGAVPSFAVRRAKIRLEQALMKFVVGTGGVGAGVWFLLYAPAAAPYVLTISIPFMIGGAMDTIGAARELRLTLDEEQARRGRSKRLGDPFVPGPPGASGHPGVFGGPQPVPALPPRPNPRCPACDAIPGVPSNGVGPGAGALGGYGGLGGF